MRLQQSPFQSGGDVIDNCVPHAAKSGGRAMQRHRAIRTFEKNSSHGKTDLLNALNMIVVTGLPSFPIFKKMLDVAPKSMALIRPFHPI
jgi:hypothetical protein